MRLAEATVTVDARSQAAIDGAGLRGSDGGGWVTGATARMLLSGVAADPEEVVVVLADASTATVAAIANGGDPVAVIRGALLETFVLGALVGTTDGGA